jgi:sulfatase maturation enzyme AslB (radical SAM superfamily)
MSINGWLIYNGYPLMLVPIGRMTKTFNRTMYAERDHLKIVYVYRICNPTCKYCLANKGQTSVKSNNVFKKD